MAFPGIFRGALDIRARRITARMKVAAAYAIAECVTDLHRDNIVPSTLDMNVAKNVAQAVKDAYWKKALEIDPFNYIAYLDCSSVFI